MTRQAVEVTKLSLLLKVLEGETQQSLQPVLRLFHERALPDLGDNIKCGNSLIGPDFYQQQQMPLLDDEERYRINVFDWAAEFPHILPAEAVPGRAARNRCRLAARLHARQVCRSMAATATRRRRPKRRRRPNHCRSPNGKAASMPSSAIRPMSASRAFRRAETEYLTTHYRSATGNCDLYVSFVERGLALLNETGMFGMITPNKFFRTDYGEGLRRLLSSKRAVRRIVDFGANQVFTATTYTCLLFLQNRQAASFEYGSSQADPASLEKTAFSARDTKSLGSAPWTFESQETARPAGQARQGHNTAVGPPSGHEPRQQHWR